MLPPPCVCSSSPVCVCVGDRVPPRRRWARKGAPAKMSVCASHWRRTHHIAVPEPEPAVPPAWPAGECIECHRRSPALEGSRRRTFEPPCTATLASPPASPAHWWTLGVLGAFLRSSTTSCRWRGTLMQHPVSACNVRHCLRRTHLAPFPSLWTSINQPGLRSPLSALSNRRPAPGASFLRVQVMTTCCLARSSASSGGSSPSGLWADDCCAAAPGRHSPRAMHA